MLNNLSEQLRRCYHNADEAKRKAEAATDPALQADFLEMEKRWLALARSYAFTESLGTFTEQNLRGRRKFDGAASIRPGLDATLRLQEISTLLIQESNLDSLYHRILDAAVDLMSSDMASMQMFDPERSELQLLAWKGFHPQSAIFWDRVRLNSGCSCGAALAAGRRIIVPDVETSEFIVGTPDADEYRRSGIRTVQSTPLLSRSGQILGMISTHWRELHRPSERAFGLFDVLARQAADLIERSKAEAALRESEERARMLGREAEHRTKNILAAVQTVVRLSQAETSEGFKEVIEGRIQALANAHTLLAESRWIGADLLTLASRELAPYLQKKRPRVRIDGPHVPVDPKAAQAIAVTLHELTTNAAKYGALSVAEGHVEIKWTLASAHRVCITWAETGGPAAAPPTRKGFGTQVMEALIKLDLQGKLRFDWGAEGLTCAIEVQV